MQHLTLHGFTGSTQSWPQDWNVNHWALTGHSTDSWFVGNENFQIEIKKITDAISIPTHLIGYSCGARLALAAALANPSNIKKLTLISVNPGLETHSEREHRLKLDSNWIRLLEKEGTKPFVQAWEALPLWNSQKLLPEIKIKRQRQIRQSHNARQLAQSLKIVGLASMPNLWPQLPTIDIPVNIVVGGKDAKFTAIAKRLHSTIQGSQLFCISKSGHNPVIEAPKILGQIIWGDHS